jgi:hypothetical protein
MRTPPAGLSNAQQVAVPASVGGKYRQGIVPKSQIGWARKFLRMAEEGLDIHSRLSIIFKREKLT